MVFKILLMVSFFAAASCGTYGQSPYLPQQLPPSSKEVIDSPQTGPSKMLSSFRNRLKKLFNFDDWRPFSGRESSYATGYSEDDGYDIDDSPNYEENRPRGRRQYRRPFASFKNSQESHGPELERPRERFRGLGRFGRNRNPLYFESNNQVNGGPDSETFYVINDSNESSKSKHKKGKKYSDDSNESRKKKSKKSKRKHSKKRNRSESEENYNSRENESRESSMMKSDESRMKSGESRIEKRNTIDENEKLYKKFQYLATSKNAKRKRHNKNEDKRILTADRNVKPNRKLANSADKFVVGASIQVGPTNTKTRKDRGIVISEPFYSDSIVRNKRRHDDVDGLKFNFVSVLREIANRKKM